MVTHGGFPETAVNPVPGKHSPWQIYYLLNLESIYYSDLNDGETKMKTVTLEDGTTWKGVIYAGVRNKLYIRRITTRGKSPEILLEFHRDNIQISGMSPMYSKHIDREWLCDLLYKFRNKYNIQTQNQMWMDLQTIRSQDKLDDLDGVVHIEDGKYIWECSIPANDDESFHVVKVCWNDDGIYPLSYSVVGPTKTTYAKATPRYTNLVKETIEKILKRNTQ